MENTGASFRSALRKALMKAEKVRALVLALVFGILLLVAFGLMIAGKEHFTALGGAHIPLMIKSFLGVGMVYFLGLFFVVRRLDEQERSLQEVIRYVTAFIEVSFPSILILIIAKGLPGVVALNSPPLVFYLIFIMANALRMSVKISVFTGVVAAVQYVGLAVYYTSQPEEAAVHDFFNGFTPYLTKGLVLLMGGVLIGMVSLFLEKRIIEILDAREERNHIMGVFGQQVSPEVVNKLLEQKSLDKAERSNVCIMFLDIRDFTKYAEQATPEKVIDLLNHLFGFMIDEINAHNGIINKFLGDGFMAVFGAPIENPSASINAYKASIAILDKLQSEIDQGKMNPLRIGIGLHSGEAMTGNVGSAVRKEYTIIGDVVNTASRIEQLNKPHGTSLLISSAVYESLPDSDKTGLKELGKVQLKGKSQEVEVYTLKGEGE